MVRRSIFLGVLVAVAFASQAQAQSLPDMTGLDLNAMNNAFNANLNAAMAQSQSRIVAQVLQSPDFQAKYQAFLSQGGQASPEQYALEYARFGGFTPEGIARARASDAADAEKIGNAVQDMRQAEGDSADALAGAAASADRRASAVGNLLSGVAPMINPLNGQSTLMPTTGPLATSDPASGQTFVRDPDNGNMFAQTPQGFQQMTPDDSGQE